HHLVRRRQTRHEADSKLARDRRQRRAGSSTLFLTLPGLRANVSAMLVGIQADDLTGACDTGAPFAARGLDTLVIVHDGDDPPSFPAAHPTVLVIDTESRHRPTEDARQRARLSGSVLKTGSRTLLYKKVDSTLRGRVAAEIDGMLNGAGLEMALLSPAF